MNRSRFAAGSSSEYDDEPCARCGESCSGVVRAVYNWRVKAAALLRDRSRLFWFLNTAGWTGYTLAAWLGALAHEKPESYFAIIIVSAISGFLATLLLRNLYRRVWPKSVVAIGAVTLLASYAVAFFWQWLRNMPEAGKELVFVLNHGMSVDQRNHFATTHSDMALKLSYTFRY